MERSGSFVKGVDFGGLKWYYFVDKMPEKDDILTKTQVLEYLKISRGSLLRLMNAREIPYYKLARRVLFRKADIDAWLESKRVK